MTTNQDATVTEAAIEAAEAGMYQRMTWASLHWNALDPDQQRELAAAALTAAAPIIAAQAKAAALREAAENLWSESLTDAVPRTEADRTARIIAVKLRRTAAAIEGATP